MSGRFRGTGPLCFILLTYVKPLEKVDAQMPAHVDWLTTRLAQGVFLLAGRRQPRTGGVILARGDADAVRKVADTDPFVTSSVATVEVIAFNASFALPEIAGLLR